VVSDEEDDFATPSTDDVVARVAEIGYSVEDLIEAEDELTATAHEEVSSLMVAGNSRVPRKGNGSLARRIVRDLVRHISKPRQWRGPLPPVRISPPRTLGDVPVKDIRSTTTWRSAPAKLKDLVLEEPSANQRQSVPRLLRRVRSPMTMSSV
jgi:hypothetical protein